MNKFDLEYNRQCNKVLTEGKIKYNERTGKNCLYVLGDMAKYDLSDGKFPLLTTKKIYTKQMIAELIGFIRAYDNAQKFRDLGCQFWNKNANSSVDWLNNPNRKGEDDLGRIYGVQARDWKSPYGDYSIDQLKNVITKLNNKIDDRRLIVNHWNPAELDRMSLPPCHSFYQFGIDGDKLDLCMYQRSADVPLGVPMNIASYALLLLLICKICNFKPGTFTHFVWNMHIYEDQIDLLKDQMTRSPFEAPQLEINDKIKSLEDLETWVTPADFKFINYNHHPAINYPFSE